MAHRTFENARSESPILGGWVTFDALSVVDLLASAGFDYLGIDTQHGMLDVPAAARLLYAVSSDTLPVLVRVPANNPADIGKLLDCGADGVIVPMVNTAGEAKAAVAACRYAPAGIRSFGPVRVRIGRDISALDARVGCFVMIETTEALKNIDAIVATKGLTGVYLGPADMAVSMGLPPAQWPTPLRLREAQIEIAAACEKAGVLAGAHALSSDHAAELIDNGYGMVTLSGDKGYMLAGVTKLLTEVRSRI
jgi:2-keto-3-deoxy-L-rhamnonate aldolase RhmA